jgi:hypothetical protein
MPAPAFLVSTLYFTPSSWELARMKLTKVCQIKSMVEIFINRVELMPPDENAEQHQQRRIEENIIVEADKAGESGLFRGCFKSQSVASIRFDAEDHVHRCSQCGHEWEGGESCANCGHEFDEDEMGNNYGTFSDDNSGDSLSDSMSGYDLQLDDLDNDLDLDEDEEDDDENTTGFNSELWRIRMPYGGFIPQRIVGSTAGRRGHRARRGVSVPSSDDEGDTGSLRDFIEDDESIEPESHRNGTHIIVESDDSDEGGAISNGRRRQAGRRGTGRAAVPIILSDSASEDEYSANNSRALQESGWSPLEQSDSGDQEPCMGQSDSENSDTGTIGQQVSDDDDDDQGNYHNRERDNSSATPRYHPSPSPNYGGRVHIHQATQRYREESYSTAGSYASGVEYQSDTDRVSVVDHDGDTEMSVSPEASRRSSSGSATSGEGPLRRRQHRLENNLGPATTIHEIQDDSSDGSVIPAVRRRPRRVNQHHPLPGYDRRISTLFSQHQNAMRAAIARQSPYFEEEERSHIMRLDSISGLRGASYRIVPPRRQSPIRTFTLSAASRVQSASDRPGRVHRAHSVRYFT